MTEASGHVPAPVGASLIGGSAVLMWATLALLTTFTEGVPPFQVTAMAFTVAAAVTVAKWLAFRDPVAALLRQPPAVWALGVGGLFGYHFFYFMALKNAPPVEAGLIAYLWPVLIVVFSALLPGERLRWFHLVGVLLGLLGTGLLVSGGDGLRFRSTYALGYGSALVCALTWSTYSVLSRRFGTVPTDVVGGFVLATAVLAWLCHGLFEATVWPGAGGWLAVVGLGLGPVGLAFFTWDHGVKRGDIRALGAFSYTAPLLSTLLLILFGQGRLTWAVAAACALITGGAVLASRDLLRSRGS